MPVLERANADILAFQEASSWFFHSLRQQRWVDGYEATTIDGNPVQAGGLYILSRYPIVGLFSRELPGDEDRQALFADIRVHDITVRVAVAHLESPLGDWDVRARQLAVLFDSLREADHALLLGDVNFGDGAPEEAHLDPSYRDLWLLLRPGERGYTWNKQKSKLAEENSFSCEPSRRLDRILVRSDEWNGVSISILGDAPVNGDPGLFPSDHFGVVAELGLPGGG